jgi:NAD+ synthase (glutamine-hydrolysing)
VAVVVFTELCLTGYTCADLFHQMVGLAVVGLPLVVDDRLFNCAAVFQEGRVLGIVPKSHIRPGCVCIRAQRDTSRFR